MVPMRIALPPPLEPPLALLDPPPLAPGLGVAPGLEPPELLDPQPAMVKATAAIAARHVTAERPRVAPRCAAVRDRNPFLSIPSSSLLCVDADRGPRHGQHSSRPSGGQIV